MAWDAHKNLAISTVATAPSPASSGTSLVVASGHGARFPAAPFNATVWPTGSSPDPANAEVLRVSAVSTDTLTIARAQEGTSARTIVVGDLIAAGITAKTLTDIEDELGSDPSGPYASVAARLTASLSPLTVNPAAGSMVVVPGVVPLAGTAPNYGANTDYYLPLHFSDTTVFDQLLFDVTAAAAAANTGRAALYAATTSWQPSGTLIEDFGTFATDSTGIKTIAPAGGTRTVSAGRYLLALNVSASTGLRGTRGSPPGGFQPAALAGAYITRLTRTRTHAAFPSTLPDWTGQSTGAALGVEYPMAMRVTAVG